MKLVTLFLPGLLSSLVSVVISDSGKDDTVSSYVPEAPREYPDEVNEASERNNVIPIAKLTNSVPDESNQHQENIIEDGKNIPQDGSSSVSKLRGRRSVKKSSRGDETGRKQRIKELRMKFLRQIKESRERKTKQRASHKSIKSKLEEEDANDTDEYDYYDDYDYEDQDDSGIYGFAHLQATLEEYFETVLQVNDSMQEELSNLNWKLSQMEKLLNENIARTKVLEALAGGAMRPNLSPISNPKLGDLRFKVSSSDGFLLKEGYLQIYSGTCWGFVCDDFFDQVAAKVACIQMGYTGDNATVDAPSTTDASTWKDDFPIALDDVSCTGREDTLISCEHAAMAEHDCGKDEIVFVSC